jgi:arginyl-tRNA synthetase
MGPPTNDRSDIAVELAERVVAAVAGVLDLQITLEQAVIREAAPEHGCDYQSNAAMALAKRVGRSSRELAEALIERLDVADLCEPPQIAGPGFINLRLRVDWLQERLATIRDDPRLGVRETDSPRRVVIDYSAPNVAKEMHVGHLRSTIIGDALARLTSFMGHEVIAQNHIGDWGTPFGMLIEHMRESAGAGQESRSIGDLGDFYRTARQKFESDESFAERSRQRVVAMQSGDPATLESWRELVAQSEHHFEEIYALLGVLLTGSDIAGESTYNDQLADVVDELQALGLAVDSDGAVCVFPDGFVGREGEPLPLIVRKRDGGYSYDTTDLAAIRHRTRELGASELIYVVGAPQRLHFEMIFAVARQAGWLTPTTRASHISFGSVLGSDHKVLRTREGAPTRLIELLREATDRAGEILAERSVDGTQSEELARVIGVGAIKYADLSSDREKDYVFSFDRMLSLEGNTSVYLQYANARACSVLRKAGEQAPSETAIQLQESAERALAVALIRLPAAIDAVLLDYKPHRLCTYLYGVAVAFSSFYENCPVLSAEDPAVRASRLALCQLSSDVLKLGLAQLGIEAPERISASPGRPGMPGDA